MVSDKTLKIHCLYVSSRDLLEFSILPSLSVLRPLTVGVSDCLHYVCTAAEHPPALGYKGEAWLSL